MAERRIWALNASLCPPTFLDQQLKGMKSIFAIWPSPFDHDACLNSAGFEDFGDTSDIYWEKEFNTITLTLIKVLSHEGPPHWITRRMPSLLNRICNWFQSVPISMESMTNAIGDAIMSGNDQWWCTIGFGMDPKATLTVEDGHAIWWIASATSSETWGFSIAEQIADGRNVLRPAMDWTRFQNPSSQHDPSVPSSHKA